jgi:preprotein translocase SecE subunit
MIKYFKNSIQEIQKVTWPTKEESLKLTVITIIFTVITTLAITLVDQAFNAGYQYLLDISPTSSTPAFDPSSIEINTSDDSSSSITITEDGTGEVTEETTEDTTE